MVSYYLCFALFFPLVLSGPDIFYTWIEFFSKTTVINQINNIIYFNKPYVYLVAHV